MEKKHMVSESGTEVTEGARRATGVTSVGAAASPRALHTVPNPEVPEKASRRKFTAEYKLQILKEAEMCQEGASVGALLRREGLYSSHLTTWRRQAQQGTLEALSARKRGPKPKALNPLTKRVSSLEKENQRLCHKLKQAEMIIEAQKKIAEILSQYPEPKDESKS
jgi:transposase-like protein